jgi:transposase InsO family protein
MAPASPWQNAYVERVIGSLRRELLDHVVMLNDRHLKRLLSSYLDYYHPWIILRPLLVTIRIADRPDESLSFHNLAFPVIRRVLCQLLLEL